MRVEICIVRSSAKRKAHYYLLQRLLPQIKARNPNVSFERLTNAPWDALGFVAIWDEGFLVLPAFLIDKGYAIWEGGLRLARVERHGKPFYKMMPLAGLPR